MNKLVDECGLEIIESRADKMSLREYYAGQVLAGILAGGVSDNAQNAIRAVQIADELLRQLRIQK